MANVSFRFPKGIHVNNRPDASGRMRITKTNRALPIDRDKLQGSIARYYSVVQPTSGLVLWVVHHPPVPQASLGVIHI